MDDQQMKFRLGLVVLMGAFALAAIVIYFGEFRTLLATQKTYYFFFEEAPGAAPQVPVRRAGVKVGEVADVEYSEDFGVVVLTVTLDNDTRIRAGDEPTIGSSLLGDTFIDLVTREEMRGRTDRPVIPAGSTLEGRSPIDPLKLVENANILVPNGNRMVLEIIETSRQWTEVGLRANRLIEANEAQMQQVVGETSNAIERLNRTLTSINETLTPQTQENLKVTVANLRQTSDGLNPLVDDAGTTIRSIRDTTARLDRVAENLRLATQPLADRAEPTIANLEQSSASLKVLLGEFERFAGDFREKDGTLQRLLKDPSLYQNIDDASYLLVANLNRLENVLKDLRVFADKIARHPGELGVQGVLTEDTGLKAVPPGRYRR